MRLPAPKTCELASILGRSRQSVDRARCAGGERPHPRSGALHALRGLLAGSGYPYKRNIAMLDRVLARRSKWMGSLMSDTRSAPVNAPLSTKRSFAAMRHPGFRAQFITFVLDMMADN